MQNANTYLNIRARSKMKIDRPQYDRRCSDRAASYLNDLFKWNYYEISILRLFRIRAIATTLLSSNSLVNNDAILYTDIMQRLVGWLHSCEIIRRSILRNRNVKKLEPSINLLPNTINKLYFCSHISMLNRSFEYFRSLRLLNTVRNKRRINAKKLRSNSPLLDVTFFLSEKQAITKSFALYPKTIGTRKVNLFVGRKRAFEEEASKRPR